MEIIDENISYETKILIHTKASEKYIHAKFKYNALEWDGWIPIEYRRTGISIDTTSVSNIEDYLKLVYLQLQPENYDAWEIKQNGFWDSSNKVKTREFFESLKHGGWKCVECDLPKNQNWARRIQDIKDLVIHCLQTLNTTVKNANRIKHI